MLEWTKNRLLAIRNIIVRVPAIDFIFNLGITKFLKSTLCKKIKANINDPAIAIEFNRWVYGRINGAMVKLPGLVQRRQKECDLYFNKNRL